MEEDFDVEARRLKRDGQTHACLELVGSSDSSGAVDFVREAFGDQSESEEEPATPFVGEITPAIRAAVKRVQEATGHRQPKRLARALLLSGAPPAAVQAARELKRECAWSA